MTLCKKIKMADGCRPKVAGGTNSSIIYESVVLNLHTKYGDPRTSSSFSAKIFVFQNGVCCRKEVVNDVMFCGLCPRVCWTILPNLVKFGETVYESDDVT